MRKLYHHQSGGPKARNEYRQTQDCEYSRGRRRNELKYLCSWGWDHRFRETKSWKDRRKKQYRDRPRGEQHTMLFDEKFWRKQWRLEQYLKAHNIPYRIEHLRETYTYERTIRTKRVKAYQVPVFAIRWQWTKDSSGKRRLECIRQHQTGCRWEYKEETLDKPIVKRYKGSKTTGYRLTWWSNKDIGIEYILRRIEE